MLLVAFDCVDLPLPLPLTLKPKTVIAKGKSDTMKKVLAIAFSPVPLSSALGKRGCPSKSGYESCCLMLDPTVVPRLCL
jgi:hypothetical protein